MNNYKKLCNFSRKRSFRGYKAQLSLINSLVKSDLISMSYKASTLPYSLDINQIKRMGPSEIATAAKETVRRIPMDEVFGKTSLNLALLAASSTEPITEFAKANIISFIRAIDDEWTEKTRRK